MTNAVMNTTQNLDHLSESQMADIAFALNAIEPGAGSDEAVTMGGMDLIHMFSGFEWGALAFALGMAVLLSVPYSRVQMRYIWKSLRKGFSRQVYAFRKG